MKKKIAKAGLGVLALVVVVMMVAFTDFYFWRSDIIEKIQTDSRRKVISTSLGDVEYAAEGEGVPMLVLHGSLGGYDSALLFGHQVDDVRIIAVSRPGYLGTPLSSGATHAEQADLFAALLDELGIDKVLVFAGSSGGPYGMQFALRHADRTLGLLLISTGLEPVEDSDVPEIGSFMLLLGDMFMWASANYFPSLLMGNLSDSFDSDDPAQVAAAKALAETLVPMGSRWAGNVNDGLQFTNPAMSDWPLAENVVPTLIVHGDKDPLAPYENAPAMASRIANSELVTIPGGGHGGFSGEQKRVFDEAVRQFVRSVTRNTQ